jgi:hypothetical protein
MWTRHSEIFASFRQGRVILVELTTQNSCAKIGSDSVARENKVVDKEVRNADWFDIQVPLSADKRWAVNGDAT